MELSKRLAAVASFVPPGSVTADIGTDHALLPIYLVKNGLCPEAIATERNEGPFLAAEQAVEQSGLKHKISLRKGNGLQVLEPGEAGTIVIAGMGGNTIRSVLAGSKPVLDRAGTLVLQPMSDPGDLRRWLCANGWRIADEELVAEDGRIYLILAAKHGQEPVRDPLLLELGPRLLEKKGPLLRGYLEKMLEDCRRVLAGLSRSDSQEARNKARLIEKKAAGIEKEVAKCP
ncbi:MAG: class I SAM-dependent methyltransferase [Armatimonadetes bacterium]|nr:class I SAM-dependent methyltransferase [Armatimonadota bacterium]